MFIDNMLHNIGQLAWLVHLIGHVIGGRIAHSSSGTYDSIDGQLVCRLA